MGAWGTGNFENDHALDWLGKFLGGDDDAPIYDALDTAVEDPELDLDAASSAAGLAAAEVVAAMKGKPGKDAPERLVGWVRSLDGAEVDPELPALAARAVQRIRKHSELVELWDPPTEWRAVLDDLLKRLKR